MVDTRAKEDGFGVCQLETTHAPSESCPRREGLWSLWPVEVWPRRGVASVPSQRRRCPKAPARAPLSLNQLVRRTSRKRTGRAKAKKPGRCRRAWRAGHGPRWSARRWLGFHLAAGLVRGLRLQPGPCPGKRRRESGTLPAVECADCTPGVPAGRVPGHCQGPPGGRLSHRARAPARPPLPPSFPQPTIPHDCCALSLPCLPA